MLSEFKVNKKMFEIILWGGGEITILFHVTSQALPEKQWLKIDFYTNEAWIGIEHDFKFFS